MGYDLCASVPISCLLNVYLLRDYEPPFKALMGWVEDIYYLLYLNPAQGGDHKAREEQGGLLHGGELVWGE